MSSIALSFPFDLLFFLANVVRILVLEEFVVQRGERDAGKGTREDEVAEKR